MDAGRFYLAKSLFIFLFVFVQRRIGCCSRAEEFDVATNLVLENAQSSNRIKFHNDMLIKLVSKRGIDSCKSLISNYDTERESSCVPVKDVSPFCDKEECPNKPSPPSMIDISYFINKSTKAVDLKVEWKEPKFGLNNLCGFQLRIASLSTNIEAVCTQLNSKNQFSFVQRGLQFGGKYNLTIISLPAYRNVYQSSRYVTLQVPGKCQLFKDLNETAPWHCGLPRYLNTTSCINGSIVIRLEKPKNGGIEKYYVAIYPGSNRSPRAIYMLRYNKEQDTATITGLQTGLKYAALVFYEGKNEPLNPHIASSKTFICKGAALKISLRTQCKNLTAVAVWKEFHLPHNHLRFEPKVKLLERDVKGVHRLDFVKVNSSIHISGIVQNADYIVTVDVILKSTGMVLGSFTSSVFSCTEVKESHKSLNPGGAPHGSSITVVIFVILAVLVAACLLVVCRKYKCHQKVKLIFHRRQRSPSFSVIGYLPQQNDNDNRLNVLILYPVGCECITEFALLLGNLLHSIGCKCILDLVMEKEVFKSGGRDAFINNWLKNSDVIVSLNYKDTSEDSQHAKRVHEDTIFQCLYMSRTFAKERFIPIYFENQDEICNASPLYFIEDIREKLQILARRIYHVPKYLFSDNLPIKNNVEIDDKIAKQIAASVHGIREKIHPECLKSECLRGYVAGESSSSFENLGSIHRN